MPIRIDATIQARMRSSRLPGKVLLPVAGEPLLARQIDRIRQSRLIDRIIVATTDNSADDPIAALALESGVECFRGSEEDVLGRIVATLKAYNIDIHVEFQGDNAMPDPLLIDSVIGCFLKHRDVWDYVTTALKTTYPPGSEVSVYGAKTLYKAETICAPDIPREHVGPHIYQRPDLFCVLNLEAPEYLNRPDLHFEVDTQKDYEVICKLYEHFLPANPFFGLAEAIQFANCSEIFELNRHETRRWQKYRAEVSHGARD